MRAIAFEVRFLEKLQWLLAEGDFSATYKFAVLLGLTELAVETASHDGYLEMFTTRQLAERVVGLYWPQVRPYAASGASAEAIVLKQNSGKQARIITTLSLLARETGGGPIGQVQLTRAEAYETCVREVEWKLIEMPLPRVQRLDSGEDRFLYEIGWSVDDVERVGGRLKSEVRAYQRGDASGFQNTIRMKPGVVETLARLNGLIRQLIEARWVIEVAKFNKSDLRDPSLAEHLFGSERTALERVRGPLTEAQAGRCFYCDGRLQKPQVDHFVPWARYPDNRIENLVVADGTCNGSKGDHLAAEQHLTRWLRRFAVEARERATLHEIAHELSWPEGGSSTLAIARHVYGQYPEEARLWARSGQFTPFSRGQILHQFTSAVPPLGA